MELREALDIMKIDNRKIFTIDEGVSDFTDEIFFVTRDKMYDQPLRVEEKISDDVIRSDIKFNKVTESHNYREITEDEFNFLWELDYDERFPELKESFEYYDRVVYKQD